MQAVSLVPLFSAAWAVRTVVDTLFCATSRESGKLCDTHLAVRLPRDRAGGDGLLNGPASPGSGPAYFVDAATAEAKSGCTPSCESMARVLARDRSISV